MKTHLSDGEFRRRVFELADRGLNKSQIGRELTGSKRGQSPRVANAYALWQASKTVQATGRRQRRANVVTGKTNAQRRTELGELKRNGSYPEFRRFQAEVNQLCVVLEHYNIEDFSLDDEPGMRVANDILEDLLVMQEWLDRQLGAVKARLSEQDLLSKIAKLRDTRGRSPEEAETALRLAERLEEKLALLVG